MPRPLVSVLMNCYNGSSFVSEAIQSVINQKYKNWELIFWDNQSTDNTKNIVESFNDKRIKYFYAPNFTNLGEARIAAQEKLSGKYVAVLDADDVAHVERIDKQVAFLEANADYVLVGTWARRINEHGDIIGFINPPVLFDELIQSLGWMNPIVNSSTMYSLKDFSAIGGYDSTFIFAQDCALVLAMVGRGKIANINNYLCDYRVVKNSMTNSRSNLDLIGQESIRLLEKAKSNLSLDLVSQRKNSRGISIGKIRIGASKINKGKIVIGIYTILKELINHPCLIYGNFLKRINCSAFKISTIVK